MTARMLGARQNTQPSLRQISNVHFRQLRFDRNFQWQIRPSKITPGTRQRIQALSRQFHLFVSQQTAHQLSTRICLFILNFFRTRQQQARFNFNQHRRHQQVFRCQIKLIRFHLGNIVQILLGNLHHRNIEDIDILLADKVQQQIQRPLEAAQHHLQRIRRNKQILRHIGDRLTEHPRNGMFRRRCYSGRDKVF